mgnify:CR=1 FL=1
MDCKLFFTKEENKTKLGVTNWLALLNLTKTVPLLAKSFFPKIFGGDESQKEVKPENNKTGRISRSDQNKAGKDAKEISKETTYESGEGNAVFIPVPTEGGSGGGVGNRTNRRGSGMRTRSIKRNIDEVTLSLYAGK